ncbi:Xaa-Pro aminopeptidase [Meinhardsimonia xiamenensis]|jgi:Xaa-Pro aminopeptidase|uniref:Xaa-Pro aminopeptidase n=1 Tax=Meinhardsimonia xiamenensis TaxID=990712 RepID=A0A1G9CWU2_9RHOB|nr:aminopeptidase P family protein [Meinhardsimonia xiamenensis]PRX38216.1 Xaa-Pro aminopeptidase [Meinhardsimonia xiamenensis]SDK56129.1 Xaa-Pro aminopeptidase [Meinhardsimonia xiamenensis]
MFQSFEATTRPEQGPPRLAALRREMARDGLQGFLVPRADAHQGEYVAPCDERLAWLTGFTGSAGQAVILEHEAAVFVDGRYTLQARAQMAEEFAVEQWPASKPGPWIAGRLGKGARVGFDPWLFTAAQVEELRSAAPEVEFLEWENLVDRIWTDRPPPPDGAVEDYPVRLAGLSSAEKRAMVGAALAEAGQKAAVLTLPDSICWLLNIRGSDIPRIPIVQAFAIVGSEGEVALYADPGKFATVELDPEVQLSPRETFATDLARLAGPVRLDRDTAPWEVWRILEKAGVKAVAGADPCLLPKARKTAAEIAATTQAHLRDGAAMAEFLAWLDATAPGELTEIDVVTRLEEARAATGALRDIAFDTIAGSGPNGAIVHYRVTRETNRQLRAGETLLIDSGGQYLDGTTDVTRTVWIGRTPPPEALKAAFTRVLKGMIAISRARWPKGLAGRDLDALARQALWQAGMDYDHGTGHGVGVYLSVHEGPQRLARTGTVPLEPGMILSNEPGHYRAGEYGIRIENLVVVREAPAVAGGDEGREMLCFDTLTWVPIDRRLIAPELLTGEERAWLDSYHAEVRRRIAPLCPAPVTDWLRQVTAPL